MTRANSEQLKNVPWFAKAGAACSIVPIARFVSENIFALKGGGYLFTLLNPGSYSLTIEAPSFKRIQFSNFNLAAGDRTREDGKLAAGAAAETVEVTSSAPLLQTDSSSLTSVVTEQTVQD